MNIGRQKQQGVAVIMVLLVLAIVAVTTSALVKRHQFNQAMTSQVIHLGQAKAHIQGGELWAHAILKQDRNDNNIDHLGETWAQIALPMPVEQGFISGRIIDLQGKFNLNSVVKGNNPQQNTVAIFERLLENLGLEKGLSANLIDWIDADLETAKGTLEDAYYLGLETPYRSANQALRDVSELALVQGFDVNIVETLKPYVAATAYTSTINVNTAPAIILEALSPIISATKAQELATLRQLDHFSSVKDFVDIALGPKTQANATQWDLLASHSNISSQHFEINISAQFGVAKTRLESRVYRSDNGVISVASRIYTP